jgi:hypothetical protein
MVVDLMQESGRENIIRTADICSKDIGSPAQRSLLWQ